MVYTKPIAIHLTPYQRLSAIMIACLSLGFTMNIEAEGQVEIPNASELAEAKKLVDEVYADMIEARTDGDRVAAARILTMRALETSNADAAKYIMLDTARSLAVEAGDASVAMDAIDGLISSFTDPSGVFITTASASLQDLSRKIKEDSQHAVAAQAGLTIAERMIKLGRLDEAVTLLSKLRVSVARSKRPSLSNTHKAISEELRVIRTESKRIADDLAAFKIKPEDPELRQKAGKFFALFLGDWDRGLLLLAKSPDKAIADAAKADMAGATTTKEQISIGDQWWALANNYTSIEKRNINKRAQYWYGLALQTSTGIQRAILTKRLYPPGKVIWGDLALEQGIRTWYELNGDSSISLPGITAKNTSWEFEDKPKGAKSSVTLHFEGYLYSSKTTDTALMAATTACRVTIEVNGAPVLRGNSDSEAPLRLIKGYNHVRGSVSVLAVHFDNPKVTPTADIGLSRFDGQLIPIPAEKWFKDITH